MKIASFNINDINRRLTNLLSWLREAEPDTVCLQELKATDTEFPAEAIRQAGYHAVWRGEKRSQYQTRSGPLNRTPRMGSWAAIATASARARVVLPTSGADDGTARDGRPY
jgi:hypothetical protein